jgi:hypothetical protein
MVKPVQDSCSCIPSLSFPGRPGIIFNDTIRNLLPDALVRSGAIVIFGVFLHDAIQLTMIYRP